MFHSFQRTVSCVSYCLHLAQISKLSSLFSSVPTWNVPNSASTFICFHLIANLSVKAENTNCLNFVLLVHQRWPLLWGLYWPHGHVRHNRGGVCLRPGFLDRYMAATVAVMAHNRSRYGLLPWTILDSCQCRPAAEAIERPSLVSTCQYKLWCGRGLATVDVVADYSCWRP